jgi:competence protein ComEC
LEFQASGGSGRITKRRFLSGRKTILPVIALFCIAVLVVPSGCRRDERLQISFLDVGQGDAVLVSQGSTQVLIDGGPSAQALMSELAGKMPFMDRSIELVVLTHPHADHINGLLEVLSRYDVGHVIYPAEDSKLSGYESSAWQEWTRLIEDRQIPSTIAYSGMNFSVGDARFEVLNPPELHYEGTLSDIDNNSIVLEMVAGKYSFLLTGDLMWQGELELVLNRKIRPVNVLKVAHHGSKTSSSREFLAVTRPDMGIICVGENSFGHPDKLVIEGISAYTGSGSVLRTDLSRGITFLTDGESLWVQTGSGRSE